MRGWNTVPCAAARKASGDGMTAQSLDVGLRAKSWRAAQGHGSVANLANGTAQEFAKRIRIGVNLQQAITPFGCQQVG